MNTIAAQNIKRRGIRAVGEILKKGRSKMELTIDDRKMKDLVKEAIIEIMKEDSEGFNNLLVGALEEVGLANAIKKGRKNTFVSEAKIFNRLDG